MRLPRTALAVAAGALLIASGCRTMPDASVPSVRIFDQVPFHGTVVVQDAVSPGPGWIVIQEQFSGRPGRVMGYAPVKAGVNHWVRVNLDWTAGPTIVLATLLVDAGVPGTMEYPGSDTVAISDGRQVTEQFRILGRRF